MVHSSSLQSLRAIVIGAGFGGLSTSIELAMKGAHVTVFESYADMKKQGDVIQIPANATRIMERWGDMLNQIVSASAVPSIMTIMNKDGKTILDQQLHTEFDGYPNVYSHRGGIQQRMFDYAVSIGVDIQFGTPVTEISESGAGATVVAGGERHTADVVVAADGVHSRSRSFTMGATDKPKKSGFAVYRSWFPLSLLRDDPETSFIASSKKDIFQIWIGKDTHAILTTNNALQSATCLLTHKDLSDVAESWHLPGDIQDMLQCVDGWDPLLHRIIEKIPGDCLIDHKLLWRDPVPNWVSERGRVCLLGDAAHPHLATSGTGAAQAIEDAATIAVLLEKTGRDNIPLALRSYQKLRYERTSLTQRMGWETRHVWHQTDWDAVAANPDLLKFPQPAWLLGTDAVKYVENNFDSVKSHIEEGSAFLSTNVPPGHVHEDWSIEMMLSREGRRAEQDFYKTRN